MAERENSFAFAGIQFGDEGKGRIIHQLADDLVREGKKVINFRDNGGANAGHTIELSGGRRIAVHELPSAALVPGVTVVLGRGMVIHHNLGAEIKQIKDFCGGELPAEIMIDREAVLLTDLHRAWEAVHKRYFQGGEGSTKRGIAPAYADYLMRSPLFVRDLVDWNEEAIETHYTFYQRMVEGFGTKLSEIPVLAPDGKGEISVGSLREFKDRLLMGRETFVTYSRNVIDFLRETWPDESKAYILEKAHSTGIDLAYGLYPDDTASNTTFNSFWSSTAGTIHHENIGYRAGVMKATYISSVGIRKPASVMDTDLANKIREDAHEYGASTGRPRGIYHQDLEATRYFAIAGMVNCLVVTHLDIVYPDTPVRACVGYTDRRTGKKAYYEPRQNHMDNLAPIYMDFDPWDSKMVRKAKTPEELPKEAKRYLDFISDQLRLPIWLATTGPQKEQGIVYCDFKKEKITA